MRRKILRSRTTYSPRKSRVSRLLITTFCNLHRNLHIQVKHVTVTLPESTKASELYSRIGSFRYWARMRAMASRHACLIRESVVGILKAWLSIPGQQCNPSCGRGSYEAMALHTPYLMGEGPAANVRIRWRISTISPSKHGVAAKCTLRMMTSNTCLRRDCILLPLLERFGLLLNIFYLLFQRCYPLA